METNGGLGVNINDSWMQRWEETISTDYDYDGDYLIRLVVQKLNLMHEYFIDLYDKLEPATTKSNDKVDIAKIINSIDKCIKIGTKVLTFNYGEEADKLFEEKGDPSWFFESSEEEDYLEWDRLCRESAEVRKKDIEKFFKLIGKNVDSWWV